MKVREASFRCISLVSGFSPEGVQTLMPGQLAANAVSDGSDELASKAQLSAQLLREFFGRTVGLGKVPLKLIDQRDVAHVDVQANDHPRVCLTEVEGLDAVRSWMSFHLENEEAISRVKLCQHVGATCNYSNISESVIFSSKYTM